MSIFKQQHQIPQTYMKSFVDMAEIKSESANQPFTPFVWLIDKSLEIEPNKRSPKKSLRKNRFYNLDNDDEESPVIEKSLSIIEWKYAETLKKILIQQFLTPQDIIDLIVFVETLHHRTESNLENWQSQINKLEKIYREVDQSINSSQNVSDEYFKGSHEIAKKQILTGIGAIGKLLFESGFLLVFNESEMNFFSSDNPVAWIHIHIDDLQKWYLENEWLRENTKNNHKQFFCFCPLTPKIALIASPFFKKSKNEIYKYVTCANFQFIFSMNLLTNSRATSTLISSTSNPYGNYRESVIELLQNMKNAPSRIGKEMLIYTNQSRYKINIENYEIENINPIFGKIKFWTKNHTILRNLANDSFIESLKIYENGQEIAGARNLKFDFVSIFDNEASILIQYSQ